MIFVARREISGFKLSVTYLVNILPAPGKGGIPAIQDFIS